MCSNEDDPGHPTDLKNVGTTAPVLAANLTKPADTTSRNPNRRSNKPIMEKRRRARINNCLNELKAILLEAMRKDPARHSKLEKADILELTVAHLKEMHRTSRSSDDAASRYRAGYLHCISEVERYLGQTILSANSSSSPPSPKIEGGVDDSQLSCRLLTHLADSLVLGSSSSNEKATTRMMSSPNARSSSDSATAAAAAVLLAMNGNAESEINNNNSNHESFNHNKSQITTKGAATPTLNCSNTSATFNMMSGDTPIISLVPSRLPTGEIAFIVPGFNSASFQQKFAAAAGNHQSDYDYVQRPTMNRKSPLSPEMPLELIVSSSSAAALSINSYRDHRHLRSSSASPSSTSSSNLSSPLSPMLANYNQLPTSTGVYQFPSPSPSQHPQQYQYTNVLPAHHNQRERHYKQQQPYQLQQMYDYDYDQRMDQDDHDQPLALVKGKREKWRPW